MSRSSTASRDGGAARDIELRDVVVRFGRVEALRGASLSLPAGQVVLLAGPNGAGKTTLMSVLLGLVRPQRAEVRVGGAPGRIDHAFKAALGYLPESVAFAEHATGRQVLSFFARARGVPRRRVDEVLEEVGLAHAARRAVRGYSRGMRQRLGLAQAILAEPPLLVLDEPTGGLDAEGVTVLWDVVRRWRDAGRTVLLSSHELGGLERRIDRLTVVRRGRVVADGTPEGLRRRLGQPDEVRLRWRQGVEETVRAGLGARLREAGAEGLEAHEDELRFRVGPEHLLDALGVVTEARAHVEDLRVEPPTLDALYARILERAEGDDGQEVLRD